MAEVNYAADSVSTDLVPDSRFQKLRRGINWEGAFRSCGGADIPENWIGGKKSRGFTHIRMSIDDVCMIGNGGKGPSVNQGTLAEIKTSIQRCKKHGMMLIINPMWWNPYYQNPDDHHLFQQFWGNMAGELKDTDPEYLMFELMNEPYANNPDHWYDLAEMCTRAIRANAPEHTVVVPLNTKRYLVGEMEKALYGIIEPGFEDFRPVSDKNVIYGVSDFESMMFTHQSDGPESWFSDLHDVPYPATREPDMQLAINRADHPTAKEALIAYRDAGKGNTRENIFRKYEIIDSVMKTIPSRWWTSQMGVIHYAGSDDRGRWWTDMIDAIEHFQFGWCIWVDGSWMPDPGNSLLQMDRELEPLTPLDLPVQTGFDYRIQRQRAERSSLYRYGNRGSYTLLYDLSGKKIGERGAGAFSAPGRVSQLGLVVEKGKRDVYTTVLW
jgi:hypothetical protein